MELKKKIERCQKFTFTVVSLYLEFAMEAVFVPLLTKFLDKLPLLTCSANTDFGKEVRRGTCLQSYSCSVTLGEAVTRLHKITYYGKLLLLSVLKTRTAQS